MTNSQIHQRGLGLVLLTLSACASRVPAAEKSSAEASQASNANPAINDVRAEPSPSDANHASSAIDDHYAGQGPEAALVEVDIINRCSETVEFCVLDDGVEKNTRLAASSHERYRLHPGARVRAKDGSFCGDTIYEATEQAKQEAIVCD